MNLRTAFLLSFLLPTAVLASAQSPTISLNQSALAFVGQIATTNPLSQSTLVSNSGSGTFNWTTSASTSAGGPWLSVSPASGTGNGAITASVNIAGLATGQYYGTIMVASAGATNSPQPISVVLTVIPPSLEFASVPPSFIAAPGTNPPSQTMQVKASGEVSMGVTISASTFIVTPTGGFISGPNWLSVTPSTGTTPLTITVSAAASTLPAGSYLGSVLVTPTPPSPGVYAQSCTVTLLVGLPKIGGVVNGASFTTTPSISPGSIGSIFGNEIAAPNTGGVASGLPLPTNLDGVQVLLNGSATPAVPLYYVSGRQINFQMPVEATAPTSTLTVSWGGLSSLPFTVNTGALYPGIFTAGTLAAALNADFSVNNKTNPAAAGSDILLYVTGLGATNPPVATGQAGASSPPWNQTVVMPTVMIDGVAAQVGFSGLAPNSVGLYQLNVTIPPGTPSGLVNVQVLAAGAASNTAQIAIRSHSLRPVRMPRRIGSRRSIWSKSRLHGQVIERGTFEWFNNNGAARL